MVRNILTAAAFLMLAACTDTPMDPGGGNNPPPGGTGGPTAPDPVAASGTISGTVTAAGVGVSGARVLIGTASSAPTGSSGQYALTDVAAGTHTVTLAAPRAFALAPGETSAKDTTVTAGRTSTVSWTLVPATVGPVTFVVFLDPAAFRPRDVTIARGDSVLWTNAQPIFHTISPDDRNQPGAWRTENIPARTGASFSHVFDTEGTFSYRCTIHAGMTGVIRVR